MRLPMPLELRDPSSGSTFQVPDEGLTIGREGGKADFQVKDNGVSKSHCRIYLDGDAWFLEDLGSANGTYLGEDKLAAPTELMPNDIISMSKTRFEVLGPVGDDGGGDEAPPPTPPPAPKAKAPAKPAPAAAAKKPAPSKPAAGAAVSAARKPAPADESSEDAGGGAAEAKGIGYFFIAVPKAIAFYLAAIPLMALNPIGTIRKGIENQKHEAKGRMELIAYAIPANLFTALLGWVCTVIVAIRYGTLNIGAILPIGQIIGALIGAVITGFIWHPVMGWIINKAKGESDERSRTNYFLMFQTGVCVVAIPTALGILLAMVPFRLILILPPLLSFAGTLVSLFISYSWLNYFNVVKWLPKLVLAFALISGVFTVLGVLSALTTAPGGGAVGGGDAAQIAADAQKAAEKAIADAEEAAKAGGEAAEKAVADAKEAGKEAAKEPPPKEARGARPPEKEKEVVAAAPPPEEKEKEKAPPPPPRSVTGGGYPAFAQMRESVEKRITDDPTLLSRTAGLLEVYKAYETDVYEIEAKYQKETAKKPALARVNTHLRDAEIYEKTEKKVKDLFGKLK